MIVSFLFFAMIIAYTGVGDVGGEEPMCLGQEKCQIILNQKQKERNSFNPSLRLA